MVPALVELITLGDSLENINPKVQRSSEQECFPNEQAMTSQRGHEASRKSLNCDFNSDSSV